jgi:hypothetical protein
VEILGESRPPLPQRAIAIGLRILLRIRNGKCACKAYRCIDNIRILNHLQESATLKLSIGVARCVSTGTPDMVPSTTERAF